MAITIDSVKILNANVSRNTDGILEVSGEYGLISSTGVVVAKQGFNGYNTMKLEMTPESREKLTEAFQGLTKQLEAQLGFSISKGG